MTVAVVIYLPTTGRIYAGLGTRRTTAMTRASIAALRGGHNLRKSYDYLVAEYVWVGRHEAHGIIVDEYA